MIWKIFSPTLWVVFLLSRWYPLKHKSSSFWWCPIYLFIFFCCWCFWCHTWDLCWFLNSRYYKTKWMNSSPNWKNIVHKAKCSDFPWRTHCQKNLKKNLMLTVVTSSLTRVSHSYTILLESLLLAFVFRTMIECEIAKLWQPKRRLWQYYLAISLVVCFFICPWSPYENISIWSW